MLKKFEVKNFKNFDEHLVLDLSKINNYEFNEKATKNGVLKNALVYGDNGSGKSNLGYAMFDIILHLTDKEKRYDRYGLYTHLEHMKENVAFSYTFAFEEGELKYVYNKADAQTLLYESMQINGKTCLEYHYTSQTPPVLNLAGAETLNTDLGSQNISFVKYVHNNTVLDLEDVNNIIFRKFFSYVNRMLWFSSLQGNTYQGFTAGTEKISTRIIENNKVKDFQEFLHKLGIDYELVVKEIDGEKQLHCKYKTETTNFYNVASTGTQSVALFYYWLIQMEEVSLVFIDEFDAFYHKNLAIAVIEELKKLDDTQSLLTTHNTDIMSNDLLRPDCYLQIINGKIKSFAESTKKELRKAHNLQKMYNAGAFNE